MCSKIYSRKIYMGNDDINGRGQELRGVRIVAIYFYTFFTCWLARVIPGRLLLS